MKKTLLSLFAVVAVAVNATAAPQFGAIVSTNGGVGQVAPGLYIADDMYSANVSYSTNKAEAGSTTTTDESTITVAGRYKLDVSKNTAFTVGGSYATRSGDTPNAAQTAATEWDKNTTLTITAGVEKQLFNGANLVVDFNIYQATEAKTKEAGAAEVKTTQMLNGGTVGIAFLL